MHGRVGHMSTLTNAVQAQKPVSRTGSNAGCMSAAQYGKAKPVSCAHGTQGSHLFPVVAATSAYFRVHRWDRAAFIKFEFESDCVISGYGEIYLISHILDNNFSAAHFGSSGMDTSGNKQRMTLGTPPSTPPLKPSLHINTNATHLPLTPPSSPVCQSSSFIPDDVSLRRLLLYTIQMIPDHIISPESWRMFSDAEISTPLTMSYFAQETNITVQITGYSNGQHVVRLLGRQEGVGQESPLVAVSIQGYRCDGKWQEVPVWRVRERLVEKVKWDQGLA